MGEVSWPPLYTLPLEKLALWWAIGLAVAIAFQTVMFLIGRARRRYDIVDVGWGLSFIVLAWTWWLLANDNWPMFGAWDAWPVVVMVSVWGIRLSLHIGKRFLASSHEDARYVELRKKWRSHSATTIYIKIFLLQALLASVIALPVYLIIAQSRHSAGLMSSDNVVPIWIGLLMWLVGLLTEVVADRQLRRHIADSRTRGTTCMTGLWKYSRHPNYFGELLMWWGIGCLGFVFSWEGACLGLIGPALLTYLIVYVSGIPPAEARAAKRADWKDYAKRTSVLIPWPPSRG